MALDTTHATPIYSDFADDPDLAPLVAMFVDEMTGRIEAILAAHQTHDWTELERTAHQLKGASGSYGFDALTPCAAEVEQSVREQEGVTAIASAVEQLVDLCQRVTAEVPHTS